MDFNFMDLSSSDSDDLLMNNFDMWLSQKSAKINSSKKSDELVSQKEMREHPDEIPKGAKVFDLRKRKRNKK